MKVGAAYMNNKQMIHISLFFKKALFLAILIVLLTAAPLFSANITVPSLQIYSWAGNDGGFALDSYGSMELQLDGGYKFGGAMKFDFTSSSLETAAFNDMLAFKSVSITLNWLLSLYIYQDSAPAFLTTTPTVVFSSRQGSLDIRTAFNLEKVRVEAFLGATLPTSDSAIGYIRSGLFLHAGTDKVEFLAELGMPRWRPLDDAFDLDLFYLLLEQRVHFGKLSIVPTFFWRPGYYQQEATLEEAMDINLDLQFHGKEESLVSGGVEGNFVYQTAPFSDMTAKAIPYIQLSTPGVVYKAQVNTEVWPFDLTDMSDMFAVFLSIEAAF